MAGSIRAAPCRSRRCRLQRLSSRSSSARSRRPREGYTAAERRRRRVLGRPTAGRGGEGPRSLARGAQAREGVGAGVVTLPRFYVFSFVLLGAIACSPEFTKPDAT